MTAAAPDLRSARLRLRPWRDEDLAPFAAMNADPEVMAHFPATLSRAESDALAARLQAAIEADGFGFWALEAPGLAPFAGLVGVARPRHPLPFGPIPDVGWRLARAWWGRGFATEAAAAALDHGFGPLGLPEVVAYTAEANARSRAVMARLGMRRDPAGAFAHPAAPEGHPARPHVLYRLRREAWRGGGDRPGP